jgi:predicted Zn-dependent protease
MIKAPLTLAALALIALTGCATKSAPAVWVPNDQWWDVSQEKNGSLKKNSGGAYFLRASDIKNLRSAFTRVSSFSKAKASLAIVDVEGVNAFAWSNAGTNYVGISVDGLRRLGSDEEALGNLLGHEFSHLELHHGEARSQRKKIADTSSLILGNIASAIVPFSGTLVSVGASAIVNSYSRDEERDADSLGMKIAAMAGYSPCGMVRVGKALKESSTSNVPTFLSTHPETTERIDTAKHMAKEKGMSGC